MKKIITFIIALLIFTNVIYAKEANLKTYTFETNEPNITTKRMIPLNTIQYSQASPVYDFIDELGHLNVVYTSEKNVYWQTFNENIEPTKLVTIPMFYNNDSEPDYLRELSPNFGAALYHDGYLYVVYARISNETDRLKLIQTDKNMAVVKYDKNGNIIDKLEMITGYNLPTNPFDYNGVPTMDIDSRTWYPFTPNQNCSIAINKDGIIGVFYGRHMANGHDSDMIFFIDSKNLEWVSFPYTEADGSKYYSTSKENQDRYEHVRKYTMSHSMGERIISTSDGEFLLLDTNDASTRGLNVTKIYENSSDNVLHMTTFKMIHYREGTTGSHGYNSTYSNIGNIIELSDGYLYVGALEKTLDRYFGNEVNESWNILVQKYNKDFYDKDKITSPQEAQLFNTEERRVTGTVPTEEEKALGRLYLTGTEVDYGIKWLTDLQNKTSVLHIRAIKLDNDETAILWEEGEMTTYNDEYSVRDRNTKFYYMIIDKDGNIIQDKLELKGIDLSLEENYPYYNGKIYYTTTNYNTITVNVLDPYNPVDPLIIDKTELYLVKGSSNKLNVTYNLQDTVTGTWKSSNPSIVSVDQNGNIKGLKNGTSIITYETNNGYSVTSKITVGDYIKGDINLDGTVDNKDVFLAIKVVLKIVPTNDSYLLGGDTNYDGKITNTDIMYMIKKILKIVE